MLLLIQRQAFYNWFKWFSYDCDFLREWDNDTKYVENVPPTEELLKSVNAALRVYPSTRDYLVARFARLESIDSQGIGGPTHTCTRDRYISHKCCPVHLAMSAIYSLQGAWAEMLDEQYHITEQATAKSRYGAPCLLS